MMPGMTVMPLASMTRSAVCDCCRSPGIVLPENSAGRDAWIETMVLPCTTMSSGPRVGLPTPSMTFAFLMSRRP